MKANVQNAKLAIDIGSDHKKKLLDISHNKRENMTETIKRLIDKEHARIPKTV